MSEDQTRRLSADEKLDLILQRFDQVEARLAALEAKSYDTRPIWERALAEILEVKERLIKVERYIRQLDRRYDSLSVEVVELKERVDELERPPQ